MDLKKNEKGIGFANTRTTTLQHCISVKLFNKILRSSAYVRLGLDWSLDIALV